MIFLTFEISNQPVSSAAELRDFFFAIEIMRQRVESGLFNKLRDLVEIERGAQLEGQMPIETIPRHITDRANRNVSLGHVRVL